MDSYNDVMGTSQIQYEEDGNFFYIEGMFGAKMMLTEELLSDMAAMGNWEAQRIVSRRPGADVC